MELIDSIQNFSSSKNFVLFFILNAEIDLLSSQFIDSLNKSHKNNCDVINVKEVVLEEIKKKFEVTFLGNTRVYILNKFYLLNKSEKLDFYNYLANYYGPHKIIVFDNIKPNIKNKSMYFVEFGNKNLTVDQYREFYKFLYQEFGMNTWFINKIYETNKFLPLGYATSLMKYQSVLGKNSNDFFQKWIGNLKLQHKYFFELSHYFYLKDSTKFFELWLRYNKDYPQEFWLSFWSEQIWRAYLFVFRAKKYGIMEAKKQAKYLPFIFINKLWRNYSTNFLANLHNDLYNVDFGFKNGKNCGLELWYHKFFK